MSRQKWALSSVAWAGLVALACCGDPESRVVIGGQPGQDGGATPDAGPAQPPPTIDIEVPDSSIPEPEFLACIQTDCVAPFATCPSSRWACQTNLGSDEHNCGACGTKCPQNPNAGDALNMTFSCTDGQCKAECRTVIDITVRRYANCNAVLDDGCESLLGTATNCSQCGDTCAAGLVCNNFQCGCPPGFLREGDTCVCQPDTTACGGRCVQTAADDANCGACGVQCPRGAGPGPNSYLGCNNATCGQPICEGGYLDCNEDLDDDPSNGCELDGRFDPNNCGACGNVCAAGKECFRGECVCDAGTFCSGTCVDLASDGANCGSCNNVCPGQTPQNAAFFSLPAPNGAPSCTGGSCDYACEPGWADCDEDIDNGCETDIQTNPLRCGSCNTQCDLRAGQICSRGTCATRQCEPGEVN